MFGNRYTQQSIDVFSARFERDGSAYVFRRNLRAAAVRVSAAERDSFVAQYTRSMRRFSWYTMAGTLTAFAIVAAIATLSHDNDLIGPAVYTSMAIVSIGVMAYWRVAWPAPVRQLARRQQLGTERTTAEARALAFERLTWGKLASAAGLALLLLLRTGIKSEAWHGWALVWPAMSAGLLVLVAVQALRKLASGSRSWSWKLHDD